MCSKKRDFNKWISKFRKSISDYSYYVNFELVYNNINKYRKQLEKFNPLIGSTNIEDEFKSILRENPETLECIPLLLATRSNNIFCMDVNGSFDYDFKNPNYTISEYATFMKKTGLFDLMQNHMINNIVDYMLGVEVGLNSNGRKNRGGHLMENLVEEYVSKTGVQYYKEMYISEIQKKWNIDLSSLSNMGKTKKRFDFVVKTSKCIYGIEVNFYASSGSKLNETARSYKMLSEESRNIPGFKFVWLTDGQGWLNAKHNLEETFDTLDNIYNLYEIENGALQKLFE